MATMRFAVQGMTCEGCENSVSRAVAQVPGVTEVSASHAAGEIEVAFASAPDEGAVRAAVEDAGFEFVGAR